VTNRVATVLVARNSLFREGLLLILSTTAFRVCKVAATIDDLSLQSIRTARPFLFLIGTVTIPLQHSPWNVSGSRTQVHESSC
jgi:hypothetical protein